MSDFEIEKASDLKYGAGFYLNMLLIGDAGSGKTTSAVSCPGKKLILDWDNGAEVVYGMKDVDIISFKEKDFWQRWNKTEKVLASIQHQIGKGDFPYDIVIGDSLSMLYTMAMDYALTLDTQRGPGGSEVTNHYKVEKRIATRIWETLLSLPVHFIATVHEAHDKDELLNRIYYFPTVRGKDAPLVVRRFREVYHCFSRPAKNPSGEEVAEYFWRTSADTMRPYLKSSLNKGQQYWPALVGPNPSVEKILKRRGIQLQLKEQKEKD